MEQLKSVLLVFCLLSGLTIMVGSTSHAGPVARELADRGDDVGIPIQRPEGRSSKNTDIQALPNRLDGSSSEPSAPKPVVEADAISEPVEEPSAASACLAQLQAIAQADRTSSPDTSDSACVIPEPVILHSTISRFPVKFTKGLTLDCPFALSLARFANDTAQALARHHLGTAIDTVLSGEGFVCRRRNNAAAGKLSEHAVGNATDWVGFKLVDGSRLSIQDTSLVDADEAGFLNSLRSAACGTFTTILGPGANAAHASHFHFDLGRAKDRKNPYRICE